MCLLRVTIILSFSRDVSFVCLFVCLLVCCNYTHRKNKFVRGVKAKLFSPTAQLEMTNHCVEKLETFQTGDNTSNLVMNLVMSTEQREREQMLVGGKNLMRIFPIKKDECPGKRERTRVKLSNNLLVT